MYSGQYIDRYPDILFELRSEYGVGGAVHVPLTTNNLLHTAVSGAHRMQGVLLLGNLPASMHLRETSQEPTVMDVAPTILALLGETPADTDYDGRVLISPVDTISLLRSSL
jgi:predicted AlkP superfamily phosphohydrolase/phosphomutase